VAFEQGTDAGRAADRVNVFCELRRNGTGFQAHFPGAVQRFNGVGITAAGFQEILQQGPFGHARILIEALAKALPDCGAGWIRVRQNSGDDSPRLYTNRH
jgi:hypothetical protein